MSESTATEPPIIRLRSPINGGIVLMQFHPGVPPTLEAMIAHGFVVEPEPAKTKAKHDA
jgi:hypothetical protein